MKSIRKLFLVFSVFALFIHANAEAKTTINWWHAFGGRLGELLDEYNHTMELVRTILPFMILLLQIYILIKLT